MPRSEGKCPSCGKIHYSERKSDLVICDCYQYCPHCGSQMAPYTPDLPPKTYGKGQRRDLLIIMVCNNSAAHPSNAPFFGTKKPVEVESTSEEQ